MCVYSKFWVEWEKKNLAPYAVHSDDPWYTERFNSDSPEHHLDRHGSRSRYRTPFEIDKDRITNSTAFRRLEYKTQVFVTHEGDNYRTRLTHSLEVAEIARHIARSLRLNEHLVEAIALGHDLGHAPYGHEAEKAINNWLKKSEEKFNQNYCFCHNYHSVENVDHLEPGYDWDRRTDAERFGWGINLTKGVREGLLTHTSMGFRGHIHRNSTFDDNFEAAIQQMMKNKNDIGLFFPGSLEAQVVRISDDLAQRIHDLEDGLRSRILNKNNIGAVIKEYFDALLSRKIFEYDETNTYLEHHLKQGSIRVPKIFIHQIVEMIGKSDKNLPAYFNYENKEIVEQMQNEINRKYKEDEEYRNKFELAANLAFVLHMWRSEEYLNAMKEEDQWLSKCRILKYLELLLGIIDNVKSDDNKKADNKKQELPSYIYIAFLRGLLLANIIEHSYWRIQMALDAGYQSTNYYDISKEIREHINDQTAKNQVKPENQVNEKIFVIIAVVDGIIITEGDFFDYEARPNELHCFKFQGENGEANRQFRKFMNESYKEILETNGANLPVLVKNYAEEYRKLSKVIWLNKFEEPEITEYVKLVFDDNDKDKDTGEWIPLKQIKIYFTGYKEICPGVRTGNCKYINYPIEGCTDSCTFRKKGRYPDINRVIIYDKYAASLDNRLKKLIRERLHNGYRIARMNYMGNKIITALLELYYKNPRLMHERVWSRLRAYKPLDEGAVTNEIDNYIKKSIVEREKEPLPETVFDALKTCEANILCLIRRIIEHIAGMTDRFITNEYNRLNEAGREVEHHDETYFFS